MTCFYCKGDMIDSTTTYVENLGNCIVIIRTYKDYLEFALKHQY